MGASALTAFDEDISFEQACEHLGRNIGERIIDVQHPDKDLIEADELRARLDRHTTGVESWVVVESKGENHLVIVKANPQKNHNGLIEGAMSYETLDVGPYFTTPPKQQLVDLVPVREGGIEHSFRSQHNIWPAGHTR